MTYYLVAFKFEGDVDWRLTADKQELVKWLRDDIAHAIYAGDGQDVTVYRPLDDGGLEKLELVAKGSDGFDEEDYADYGYELSGVHGVEATFSVRIDGRA